MIDVIDQKSKDYPTNCKEKLRLSQSHFPKTENITKNKGKKTAQNFIQFSKMALIIHSCSKDLS